MKKRLSLLVMLSLMGTFLASERAWAVTIAAAKALPLGTVVTLDDVVISNTIDLVNSANSATFNVQDGSGGATIFGLNADIANVLTGLSAGDQIDVTGTTVSFNGLFQLAQPSLATSLLAPGVGVPAPVVLTPADLQDSSVTAESLESTLVSLANVTFTGIIPGETFAGSTNYTVTDGVNNVRVRIQTTDLSLVGDLIPTGPVNISGILAQFDTSNPLPGVPGIDYELRPLDDSSITLSVPEPSTSFLTAMAATAVAFTTAWRKRGRDVLEPKLQDAHTARGAQLRLFANLLTEFGSSYRVSD